MAEQQTNTGKDVYAWGKKKKVTRAKDTDENRAFRARDRELIAQVQQQALGDLYASKALTTLVAHYKRYLINTIQLRLQTDDVAVVRAALPAAIRGFADGVCRYDLENPKYHNNMIVSFVHWRVVKAVDEWNTKERMQFTQSSWIDEDGKRVYPTIGSLQRPTAQRELEGFLPYHQLNLPPHAPAEMFAGPAEHDARTALHSKEPTPEESVCADWDQNERVSLIQDALTVLDERERFIFEQRRLSENPPILADLAKGYGITRERVRQIEKAAFKKVQEWILSHTKKLT